MSAAQAVFSQALFDPAQPVPQGLTNPDGTPAGKRFNVYRNNVVVSLTKALEAGFPVLLKLLGPDQFQALAHAYLRAHPPATPLMMHYGHLLPEFLQGRVDPDRLGYLPDIARLELALRHAYHAADVTPVSITQLQSLPPERLMQMRIDFAPCVQLLRSRWPIHGIWQFQMQDDAPKPVARGENVLILRLEFDPVPKLLPPGGGVFVAALLSGQSLEQALDATLGRVPDFDLAAMLSMLLSGGAIITLITGAST